MSARDDYPIERVEAFWHAMCVEIDRLRVIVARAEYIARPVADGDEMGDVELWEYTAARWILTGAWPERGS